MEQGEKTMEGKDGTSYPLRNFVPRPPVSGGQSWCKGKGKKDKEHGTRKTWAEIRTEAEGGQGGQEAGWGGLQSVLHDASDGFSGCRGRALPRTQPCRREAMPLSSGGHGLDIREDKQGGLQILSGDNMSKRFPTGYETYTSKYGRMCLKGHAASPAFHGICITYT